MGANMPAQRRGYFLYSSQERGQTDGSEWSLTLQLYDSKEHTKRLGGRLLVLVS